MWSLAVEMAFYAALPLLAYVLLMVLCRGRWRPGAAYGRFGGHSRGQPGMAAGAAHHRLVASALAGMWLPAHLLYFAGGMVLAVLRAKSVRMQCVRVPFLWR